MPRRDVTPRGVRAFTGFRLWDGKSEMIRIGKDCRRSRFALRFSPSRDEKLQACHEETGSLLASRSKKAKCCFPYWLADGLASPARADSGARAPLSIHMPLWAETPSRRPWKLMAERIDTLASGVSCQLCPSSLLSNTPWVCSAVASRR